MENKLTEQDIFVGATVIRADGLKGKITALKPTPRLTVLTKKETFYTEIYVCYENSTKHRISTPFLWNDIVEKEKIATIEINEYNDVGYTTNDFYLIGHCVLGNRIEVSEIDERIAKLTDEKNKIDAQIDQLRKQRFRLNNQMDGRTVAERKAEEQTRPKKDETHERMRLEQIRHEKQRLQAERNKIFKSLDEKKKKDGDDE